MSHEHHHGQDDGHGSPDQAVSTRAYWDERYAGSDRVWSGRPNTALVTYADGLTPGRALDVGCGEGADAVWLAEQGWTVTGVDVSGVAVERAIAHAEQAGVADRAAFQRLDLVAGDPLPGGPGSADLVTTMFLHLPPDSFDAVYRRLADTVAPGGVLLVAGHHPADADTGMRNAALAHLMFGPERVTEALDPAEWTVEVADTPTRDETHDGVTRRATDSVVRARRRV